MSIKKSVGNVKGFTLVELLIVVAIIGVLASQGVPAYRRMIQKSRKGEAQNFLAAIAAGQSAFYSEYGVYGNNLPRMGVQIDGQGAPTSFTYVGAMDSCAADVGAGGVLPTAATAPTSIPASYFLAAPVPYNQVNRIGRTSMTQNCVGIVPVNNATAGASTYTAAAQGLITGGILNLMNSCNAGGLGCDIWTMTQNKVITNTQDGIQN